MEVYGWRCMDGGVCTSPFSGFMLFRESDLTSLWLEHQVNRAGFIVQPASSYLDDQGALVLPGHTHHGIVELHGKQVEYGPQTFHGQDVGVGTKHYGYGPQARVMI